MQGDLVFLVEDQLLLLLLPCINVLVPGECSRKHGAGFFLVLLAVPLAENDVSKG
jgi:hypothetical protein